MNTLTANYEQSRSNREFTATNSNEIIWKTKNILLHFYCIFKIYI